MDPHERHAPVLLDLVPLEVDLRELRDPVVGAEGLGLAGARGGQGRKAQRSVGGGGEAASREAGGAASEGLRTSAQTPWSLSRDPGLLSAPMSFPVSGGRVQVECRRADGRLVLREANRPSPRACGGRAGRDKPRTFQVQRREGGVLPQRC